jgi:hypothetical protein
MNSGHPTLRSPCEIGDSILACLRVCVRQRSRHLLNLDRIVDISEHRSKGLIITCGKRILDGRHITRCVGWHSDGQIEDDFMRREKERSFSSGCLEVY